MEERKGKCKTEDLFDCSIDNSILTDPNGSWTGVSIADPMEKPIQDADDL